MARTATPPSATMFSAFLRESGKFLPQVEHRDLLLERRDGSDLLLVTAERERKVRDALYDMARLFRSLLDDDVAREALLSSATDELPWTRFLPEGDRAGFLRDFAATLEACADLDSYASLASFLHEWRETALVWADPDLVERLRRPSDFDAAVPRSTLAE